MDKWPFYQVRNMDELMEQIKRLVCDREYFEAYLTGIDEHLNNLGNYESGHAAEAVVNKIIDYIGKNV